MTERDALAGRRALIVEDEPALRNFVRDSLRREGMETAETNALNAALAIAGERPPDVVILDLGLPDGCGLGFVGAFRRWSQRPILVLSARQAEADKIAALDAGADDYLTKPFAVGELLARLRALLRRTAPAAGDEPARFAFADVAVDLARHSVSRGGQPLRLSATEFRLLAVLLGNAGKVLTHRQLLQQVWGPGHAADSHYLRIYVGRLRQKLERDPTRPEHLLTELGVGYRCVLETPESPSP